MSPARKKASSDAGAIRVTQVRSVIHRPQDQKDTVRRLGLHRINDSVVKADRPEIRGMIRKVQHLVRVEEVSASSSEAVGGKVSASSSEAVGGKEGTE